MLSYSAKYKLQVQQMAFAMQSIYASVSNVWLSLHVYRMFCLAEVFLKDCSRICAVIY